MGPFPSCSYVVMQSKRKPKPHGNMFHQASLCPVFFGVAIFSPRAAPPFGCKKIGVLLDGEIHRLKCVKRILSEMILVFAKNCLPGGFSFLLV